MINSILLGKMKNKSKENTWAHIMKKSMDITEPWNSWKHYTRYKENFDDDGDDDLFSHIMGMMVTLNFRSASLVHKRQRNKAKRSKKKMIRFT